MIRLRTGNPEVIAELADALKGFEDCFNLGRFMLIPFRNDGNVDDDAPFDHCYFTYTSARKFCRLSKRSSGRNYCCWLVPAFDTAGIHYLTVAEEIGIEVAPSTLEVVEMRVISKGALVARWPDSDGLFEKVSGAS